MISYGKRCAYSELLSLSPLSSSLPSLSLSLPALPHPSLPFSRSLTGFINSFSSGFICSSFSNNGNRFKGLLIYNLYIMIRLTSTRIGRTLGLCSLAVPNTWTLNAPILSLSSAAKQTLHSSKDSELSTATKKVRSIPFMICRTITLSTDTRDRSTEEIYCCLSQNIYALCDRAAESAILMAQSKR